METKVSSGDILPRILATSNMTAFAVYEAVNFSRGIWVLWDGGVFELDIAAINHQAIAAIVKKQDKVNWVLLAVYASPNHSFRATLWAYLQELGKCINSP